eukprot:m.79090 g.79090  ORF g.79090 m.79090 type:complete len:918 (+) comp8591_c0_seq4:121-2874(+)
MPSFWKKNGRSLVDHYVGMSIRQLDKGWKYGIIVIWIALIAFCGYRGFGLFEYTSDSGGTLPETSLAYQADAVLSTIPFGDLDSTAMTLTNPNGFEDSDFDTINDFYGALADDLMNWDGLRGNFMFETISTTYVSLGRNDWFQFAAPKDTFLSDDRTQLISIVKASNWDTLVDSVDWMRAHAKNYSELLPIGTTTIRSSGNGIVWEVILDSLEHDLIIGDSVSIPFALIILCLVMKSARYVFVPILSIAASTVLSFSMMLPIAKRSPVSSVVPNLIMSISIAMSVDYSLFVFSRFREECRQGKSVREAVAKVMVTAGKTIFVSSITFIGCSLSMLIIPFDLLNNLGVSASLSVLSVMLFNLTCTPAIILSLPNFFLNATIKKNEVSLSQHGIATLDTAEFSSDDDLLLDSDEEMLALSERGSMLTLTSSVNSDESSTDQSDTENAGVGSGLLFHAAPSTSSSQKKIRNRRGRSTHHLSVAEAAARARLSPWYTFSQKVTHHPYIVILLIIAIAVAAGYPALTFKHTGGVTCNCPVNNLVIKDFFSIASSFGGGYMFPYALIVHGKSASELLTQQHTDKVNEVIKLFSAEMSDVELPDFDGLSISNSKTLDFTTDIAPCLPFCNDVDPSPECTRICFYAAAFQTIEIFNATMTFVRPSVVPETPQAQVWVRNARKKLAVLEEKFGTKVQLGLGDVEEYDVTTNLFRAFPEAIGAIVGVVFVLTLIAFQSIVIAFKAVISITLTQSLVYGIGTCVYQYGILNWMQWYSVKSVDGLCWIPVFVSFSTMVGLGLDYHVFLLGRVIEFRKQGFSDTESVMLGIARTGRVITAAGIIMAIAFFGLLFSHSAIVQQLASFVIVAVLLDTFVVRACLVPALMTIMGSFNWWPMRMPTVHREVESLKAASLRRGPVSGRLVFHSKN